MSKIKIGIIFGGRSGEHEVSVRSAKSVIETLDRERYQAVPIAIDKNGKWLSATESARMLPATTQHFLPRFDENADKEIAFIGDPTRQGLTFLSENSLQNLDVV
ncbi:MAG: D-alanine--D-alanine ligase A, partial [Pyrinomonadaceae bacterium]|nr:D-alanine--D-alanine ligase A [Pyrinomonadaceae bacterium]